MIRSNSIPVRWQHMTKASLLPVVLVLFAAGSAFAQVQYAITDLGTLGGDFSYAYGINNSGQVVGAASYTSYTPLGTQHYQHAFLYSGNGPMTDLGTLGGTYSQANGINDSGQVVGKAWKPATDAHAFLYNGSGPMQDLGTLSGGGGSESYATAINNSGQVVGASYDFYSSSNNSHDHAFFYSGSGPMQDLTISGGRDRARGINDSGQVVGNAENAQGDSYAFRTSPNSPLDPATDNLGTLGGSVSGANGINGSGQVVGFAYTSVGSYNYHAFLYGGSGPMQDLGTLGTYINYNNVPIEYSEARGINNSGQVVGAAMNSSTAFHAFLYSGSGPMQDLNNLVVPSSGWILTEANAINDKGQIVGSGTNPAGQTHAFVLSPIPEVKPVNRNPSNAQTTKPQIGDSHLVPLNDGGIDPSQMTIVLTHGLDAPVPNSVPISASAPNWMGTMADAIKTYETGTGKNVNILMWNWDEDARTFDLEKARQATPGQGKALGEALVRTLGSGYSQPIQFVGHSLGTLVNAAAADYVYGHGFDPQKTAITMLDESAAFAKAVQGDIRYLATSPTSDLNWISPLPTHDVAWIDTYISMFGVLQSKAVNVILQESLARRGPNPFDAHRYAIDWYEQTIGTPGDSTMGFRRSFAYGDLVSLPIPSVYAQTSDFSDSELALQSMTWEEANRVGPQAMIARTAGLQVLREAKLEFRGMTEAAEKGIQAVGNFVVDIKQDLISTPIFKLFEHSPTYAWVPLTIPNDALLMSFDFQFDGVGADDFITVGINDSVLFALAGQYGKDGVLSNSGLLDISAWAGSEVELFLGYNSDGITGGAMTVENLTFYSVPEPSTIVLLGIAAIGLLGYALRRQKGSTK